MEKYVKDVQFLFDYIEKKANQLNYHIMDNYEDPLAIKLVLIECNCMIEVLRLIEDLDPAACEKKYDTIIKIKDIIDVWKNKAKLYGIM